MSSTSVWIETRRRAAARLTVQLRKDVQAMQPLEGDCAASRCQCGMSLLGSTLKLRLPGGSGQLVALVLASDN